MPRPRPTKTSTPTTSERKLSDVAKHLVVPSGIKTTGYPAVEAQCRKMGVQHDPWQKGLARAILAKRANGLYAAGIGGVLISICRQVGKTFSIGTIVFALCILFPGIKVLWTAHHSATSDETFETLSALARRRRIAPYIAHNGIRQGNGKQRIKFANGSRIMFGAREHGFGRGIPGVTIVVFDEAQILKAKALSDMIPAANTAKNPLIIYMGTPPKPDDPAEVFRARRKKALAIKEQRAKGEAVDYDTLYVEVGADAGDDVEDRATLEKANPSFPHRTPWEAILRLRENLTDPSDWAREGLGIWDEEEVGGSREITAEEWQATEVESVPQEGLRALGVAFSADGTRVAVAGALKHGASSHLELIDANTGSLEDGIGPLADWIALRAHTIAQITISGRAGADALALALRERKVSAKAIRVASTPEYFAACSMLPDAVRGKTVTHPAAPEGDLLDASVAVCDKKFRGTAGAWGWAATTPDGDETPTEAISLALWGVRTTKRRPGKKQEVI
ncbi:MULTISPECIES: hypothetical protein [unclassified Microbacterium]|uniref:hypothetical protein n=1 Tax=unclassified Microbacterium TaxID=2609290 RepID=UPI0025FFAFAC|nr:MULTISPECIES: hypothetical protein [unclassified Microbacterium]